MRAPDSVSFSQVRSVEAAEAFAFHERISRSDTHIWPRTREQLSRLAGDGLLFGARLTKSREIVGLCYLTADELEEEWEIGGLTIAQDFQHLGIGTFLVRFAIAHALAFDAAPDDKAVRRVIAFVHEENQAPRILLDKLGFIWVDKIEVPAADAPASMKRNAAGNLVGDKFLFAPAGLRLLSRWLDGFEGKIHADGPAAIIEIAPPVTLDHLREALNQLADLAENI